MWKLFKPKYWIVKKDNGKLHIVYQFCNPSDDGRGVYNNKVRPVITVVDGPFRTRDEAIDILEFWLIQNEVSQEKIKADIV